MKTSLPSVPADQDTPMMTAYDKTLAGEGKCPIPQCAHTEQRALKNAYNAT